MFKLNAEIHRNKWHIGTAFQQVYVKQTVENITSYT